MSTPKVEKKHEVRKSENLYATTPAFQRAIFALATQSFQFGFSLSSMNSTLIMGDNHSGPDCFNNRDPTCGVGTAYNNVYINPGKFRFLVLSD
jgi:hypothetical protein